MSDDNPFMFWAYVLGVAGPVIWIYGCISVSLDHGFWPLFFSMFFPPVGFIYGLIKIMAMLVLPAQ